MNEIRKYTSGALVQGRKLWPTLLIVYLAIGLLFVGVGVLSQVVNGVSLEFFLRDIVATGKLPFFAGFVSQLGGMLWCASLTVCLFSLLVLRRQNGSLASSKRFMLQAAILTGVLLLDDIFLFHEEVAPNYLHIPEKLVMAGYLLLGVAFVFLNMNEILSSEYLLLGLARHRVREDARVVAVMSSSPFDRDLRANCPIPQISTPRAPRCPPSPRPDRLACHF